MEAWERVQRTPITAVCVIAYVTMAFLTFPDTDRATEIQLGWWLEPWRVSNGEPWLLVTHAFFHANFVHLGLNMLALLWVGPGLELTLGPLRFAVLYMVGAIGGGACVAFVNSPLQPVLGGSGALFGLFGAAIALHARAGRDALEFLQYQGPRQLIGLVVINLILGFAIPVVSNAGHIGGLIAGFCLALVWFDFGHWRVRRGVQLAVTAATLGFLVNALWPVTRWDWLWLHGHERTAMRSSQLDGEAGDLRRLQIDERRR